MTGNIAVDFGASNTVIARWNQASLDSSTIYFPDLSKGTRQGNDTIWMIPSIIHYAENNRVWIGNQVLDKKLYHSKRTFRWMKRYISNRSPMRVRVDDREVTPSQAGEDFLKTILALVNQLNGNEDAEVAFSVPVEAFEHYENWISLISEKAGISRYRIIDEPSAAALGYGSQIHPGQVFIIFDFGGGTMHAAVILMEDLADGKQNKRCRILGKAGKSIGGSSIDQWLFQETLKKNNLLDSDEQVRQISNSLLIACEKAKENLSFLPTYEQVIVNQETDFNLNVRFTRNEYEDLLDKHDLFLDINQMVGKAIKLSRERGYDEDKIASVYMVGGSSHIPAVQRVIKQTFGKERVFFDRPLDAVAHGASAFISGIDYSDHIQHEYAIRHLNPVSGRYQYHVIVKRGTLYPTLEPISNITIKAAYNGQIQLGIAIFELSGNKKTITHDMQIVFDASGSARIMPITSKEEEENQLFWMNEKNPTFLPLDNPGTKGNPYFYIEFRVDRNKRLIMSVKDLTKDLIIHSDLPVIKLT